MMRLISTGLPQVYHRLLLLLADHMLLSLAGVSTVVKEIDGNFPNLRVLTQL